MGVGNINKQLTSPQTRTGEPDVNGAMPEHEAGQQVARAAPVPLQALTQSNKASTSKSQRADGTQPGAGLASIRSKRDTTSATAPSSTVRTASTTDATTDTEKAQSAEVIVFNSLSEEASAVFYQRPRPSLRNDANRAFEKAFPNAPRPVDLDKLYVNTWKWERPDPNSAAVPKLVSSRPVSEYVAERYSGGPEIDLNEGQPNDDFVGIYDAPDATGEQKDPWITAPSFESFIKSLPADKAKDVSLEQKRYFETPGADGRKPITILGEIRKKQIEEEANLQSSDGTLSPEGRALVDTVAKHPTDADLEQAYPDASKRPRVYALQIRNLDHHGDPIPAQNLRGPFVMMTPHADKLPGERDRVVLFVPGQGLEEFKSLDKLTEYISSSSKSDDPDLQRNLLAFLTEQEQADFQENPRYQLEVDPTPLRGDYFEQSVQQQFDKQGRDTVYRMAQAGKAGVNLDELDRIAVDSTDDVRKSFDANGPLGERDVRLVEQNRPDWWKKSTDEDKNTARTYQDQAKRDDDTLKVLESRIPTLAEHTADAIRKEWGEKYPGIDPDEIEVELKFRLPTPGPNRINPNPQPQFETKKVSLTQYVAIGRKLVQAPTVDDTGIAGQIFDRLPGTSIARSFRKVEVSATIKNESGAVVATLNATDLNALAQKLDVGKTYEPIVRDKYPALREPWKTAYKSRMKADFQEAKMRGDLSPQNDRIRYPWVQAVLDDPNSSTRQKVGTHTIQTEALNVDLRGPNSPRSIRDIFAVSGVLVIGAVESNGQESRGSPSVVVYTPDPPAGEPKFHLFDNREAISKAAIFKKPEWVKYFKARIADIDVPKKDGKGADMTRYDAFDLHATPRITSGYNTFLTTRVLKEGDFTEGMYDAEFTRIKDNANAYTITNEEERRAEEARRQGVVFGTLGEIRNFVLVSTNLMSLPQVASRGNPRKTLSHAPKGQHLTWKNQAGKRQFGVSNSHNDGSPSLKGYAVRVAPADLKYNKEGDVYTDGANNEYIRIGNKFYLSNFQKESEGRFQRGIYRPGNALDRFDVERINGKWVVKQKAGWRGGGVDASSTHPDIVRMNNLVRELSRAPFDEQALRRNGAELIDVLSADANQDTFRRLIDLQTAEGNLTLEQRAEILSQAGPYQRASRYLEIFPSSNDGTDRAKLPDQIRRAVANGQDVASAAATVERLLAADRQSLDDLAKTLSTSQLDAATFAPKSALQKLLQSPANQDTLSRLVDLQTAEGNLTLWQRAEILSQAGPYERARHYLEIYSSSNVGADRAKLPDQIRRAVANGQDVSSAAATVERLLAADRQSLDDLAKTLSTSQLDAATFAPRSALENLMWSPANQDTLNRLVDLQTAEGNLTLWQRAEILSQAGPYERARHYLEIYSSSNVGADRAKLPDQIRRAVANGQDVASAAATVERLLAADRQSLRDLAKTLSTSQLDAATFGPKSALQKLLQSPANQDAFQRLIDIQHYDGRLSAVDRLKIIKESNPYERAHLYLEVFQSGNVGSDRKKLPQDIQLAISWATDQSTAQRVLDGLVENWVGTRLDGQSLRRNAAALINALAADGNMDVFQRLIDIQHYDGRISTVDRLKMINEPDP
ncbi:dermonecrotic toxin domain-containing protein, partial [Burkholderia ubonensis]